MQDWCSNRSSNLPSTGLEELLIDLKAIWITRLSCAVDFHAKTVANGIWKSHTSRYDDRFYYPAD